MGTGNINAECETRNKIPKVDPKERGTSSLYIHVHVALITCTCMAIEGFKMISLSSLPFFLSIPDVVDDLKKSSHHGKYLEDISNKQVDKSFQ